MSNDDFEKIVKFIQTLNIEETQGLRDYYIKTASFFEKRSKTEIANVYHALARECLKRKAKLKKLKE